MWDNIGWDGAERRHFKRFKVKLRASLSCVGPGVAKTYDVVILDLSEGGCLIKMEQSGVGAWPITEAGCKTQVEFFLPPRSEPFRAVIDIRWYLPAGEDALHIGAEFVSLPNESRTNLLNALRDLGR